MKLKIILFLSILLFFECVNSFAQPYIYFGGDNAIIYDVCFSSDGKLLIVPENSTIYVFDIKEQSVLYKLNGGHTKQILSVDISTYNSMIVSGGQDSLVVLWDMINNKVISRFNYHKGLVTSVKFSPDQKFIASGSSDRTVVIYNIKSNKIEYQYANHSDDITSVAFSPDGKLLACASADKSISLLRTDNWSLIKVLKGHNSWVRDVKFSSDNSKLISCGDDAKVIEWNIVDLNNIKMSVLSKKGRKWLLSLDINADNKTIVIGNLNGEIKIETSAETYTYNIGKSVQKVHFQPNSGDELIIAAATRGKAVILLNSRYMTKIKK